LFVAAREEPRHLYGGYGGEEGAADGAELRILHTQRALGWRERGRGREGEKGTKRERKERCVEAADREC
jgi:hypothetical protein